MVNEGVSAVVYNPELKKFLLMKRADDKEYFPGKWEFPGGTLEDEEPCEGVLRELREEIGCEGIIIEQRSGFEWESEHGVFRTHAFLIELDRTNIDISKEHEAYQWVELEELPDFDCSPVNRRDLEALDIL